MNNYIIDLDGELYHYGVKGMKWGVRKDPTSYDIGSNYQSSTITYTSGGGGGGLLEEEEEEDLVDDFAEFLAAGKLWIDSRLHMRVVDIITGKADPVNWKEAKEWAKYHH